VVQQAASGSDSRLKKSDYLMLSWQLTVQKFLSGAPWDCPLAMKRTPVQSTTVGFPSETSCVNSSARPRSPSYSRLGHLKSLNGLLKVSDQFKDAKRTHKGWVFKVKRHFGAVVIGALVGLALQQVIAFVAGESCSS
jgi:hypothetical protein